MASVKVSQNGCMRASAIAILVLSVLMAVAAPLLGVAITGQAVMPYLDFPPRTEFVPHAPFAWGAFSALSLPAIGALALYAIALFHARPVPREQPLRPFPWWGWLGLVFVAGGWVLAWSGDFVPPGWRRHTFTPLWLGYILVMNEIGRAHV